MRELPEELRVILHRIARGMNRQSIAAEENIQVNSLDQRFRRHAYYWVGELRNYCRRDLNGDYIVNSNLFPARAMQVLLQCRSVKADKLQIAHRLDFRTGGEMDEYMQSHQLLWHEEQRRYVVGKQSGV